ncbi:hypothetical protein J6590_003601 [Homalodisca vitripennis]|nr:hypothetical protein J6590_003601 [Homalodisca vitripennis]
MSCMSMQIIVPAKIKPRRFALLYGLDRHGVVQQFFPIVGHSYSPCDRDFSIIKRRFRKRDRLYIVHELTSLIIQSSSSQKFLVVEANEDIIYDYQSWWPNFYKKSPISCETKKKPKQEQISFGISSLYHFEYDTETKGVCTAMPCINGIVKHSFRLAHSTMVQVQLPTSLLYSELGAPLKLNKMIDIEKALPYVPDEHQDYYENLLANSMALFTGNEDE